MALFTGKGDGGTTGTFGTKDRVSKNSLLHKALGGLDEINSLIGFCRATVETEKLSDIALTLLNVQEYFFVIQAELAAEPEKLIIQPISADATKKLEVTINNIEKEIGPVTKFSIPGGHPLSGLLDYARAVCRRVERDVVAYNEEKKLNPAILSYLNRLSSLFFALARLINKRFGIIEKNPSYPKD